MRVAKLNIFLQGLIIVLFQIFLASGDQMQDPLYMITHRDQHNYSAMQDQLSSLGIKVEDKLAAIGQVRARLSQSQVDQLNKHFGDSIIVERGDKEMRAF